ncbi:protein dpy-30 homolog [Episyrphus balteatus]|uniref:protein dpy-30 homolog n=1 Tax=Episyrphus balteatus TaxID=286459 RepID=UPI002485DF27|nr:protein dpy-30 homolog [Episyrphus balteatus]
MDKGDEVQKTDVQMENVQHQQWTKKKKPDLSSLPTRQYLDQTVAPILLHGLQTLARERPPDPVSFLAAYLLKHKSRIDDALTTDGS